MEPTAIIIVFWRWLENTPQVFMPKSWQHLPDLAKNLAELPDEDLFFIAHTIGKWCARHNLGDRLREEGDRLEIDDPPENTSPAFVIANYVPEVRQKITECYDEFLDKFQA